MPAADPADSIANSALDSNRLETQSSPQPSTSSAHAGAAADISSDADKLNGSQDAQPVTGQTSLDVDIVNGSLEAPAPGQTSQSKPTLAGISDLHEFRKKLMLMTGHNLANSSALVRKAAIHMLEFVALHTSIDIAPFLGSQVFTSTYVHIVNFL